MSSFDYEFWQKVAKSEGCWEWQAGRTSGYGVIKVNGVPKKAHRVAYELENGNGSYPTIAEADAAVIELRNRLHTYNDVDRR